MTEQRRAREAAGRKAEGFAANWLRLRGYKILEQRFKTPDGEFDAIYSDGVNNIQLSIRSYVQQAPGKELISYNNRLYNQDIFINTRSGRPDITNSDFNYIILTGKDGKRELISYQF